MTESPTSRLLGARYTSWALAPDAWLSPFSTRILSTPDALAELDALKAGEQVPRPWEVESA